MISSKLVPLKIGAEIRSSLSNWDYSAQKSDRIAAIDSFRELLFSPSRQICEIDINSDHQIEAKIPAKSFHSSIKKDFHHNYIRISQLQKAFESLEPSKTPVAWKVVTCYYKSFFSAIETLRLLGKLSLYFNDEEVEKIQSYSQTVVTNLRSGTYSGSVRTTTDQDFKITLTRHDKSHHAYVWETFNNSYNSIINASRDLNTGEKRKLLTLGGNYQKNIPSPSEIRNKWNYQRADYFGTLGEANAMEFRKITQSPGRVEKWFEQSNNSSGENQNLCNLAYLSTALQKTLDDIHNLIMSTETTI